MRKKRRAYNLGSERYADAPSTEKRYLFVRRGGGRGRECRLDVDVLWGALCKQAGGFGMKPR